MRCGTERWCSSRNVTGPAPAATSRAPGGGRRGGRRPRHASGGQRLGDVVVGDEGHVAELARVAHHHRPPRPGAGRRRPGTGRPGPPRRGSRGRTARDGPGAGPRRRAACRPRAAGRAPTAQDRWRPGAPSCRPASRQRGSRAATLRRPLPSSAAAARRNPAARRPSAAASAASEASSSSHAAPMAVPPIVSSSSSARMSEAASTASAIGVDADDGGRADERPGAGGCATNGASRQSSMRRRSPLRSAPGAKARAPRHGGRRARGPAGNGGRSDLALEGGARPPPPPPPCRRGGACGLPSAHELVFVDRVLGHRLEDRDHPAATLGLTERTGAGPGWRASSSPSASAANGVGVATSTDPPGRPRRWRRRTRRGSCRCPARPRPP